MYSQSEYEMNELIRFNKECQAIERAPLQSRQQGRTDLKDCLNNNLKHWITYIEFLINGDYGAGSKFAFERLSKRMNRRAWLFNNVAVIEFGTSLKMACEVWNGLDTDLQAAINVELDKILTETDKEQ